MTTHRTMRTAGFWLSLYALPFESKSIWRRMASRRLSWPFTMLANVGAFESTMCETGVDDKDVW